MKAFPDINWELDKINLFNPYSTLMEDDHVTNDIKNPDDLVLSPRIIEGNGSCPENLV